MRGDAFDSACQTLREMGYFGDPEPDEHDSRDWRVIRESEHTARKVSYCSDGYPIQVGARYRQTVCFMDGKFTILKYCVPAGKCRECREKQEAAEEKALAAMGADFLSAEDEF